MANPTATFYTVGSGQTVFGGIKDYPSWRLSQQANTWKEIPTSNTLADLNPENNPAINPNFPSKPEWMKSPAAFASIITAWCGGCYDNLSDTLWLPLQGGHADYAGNEPYKVQISEDVPVHVMVRPPSGAVGNVLITDDGQEITGVYSDNRPRAIHSYNKPVFIPNVGPAIAVQGNCSWSGQNGTSKFIQLNPANGEAIFGAINPSAGTSSGGGACYDPSRHAVWWRHAGTGFFSKYDIATNTWTSVGNSKAVSGYSGLEYLPDDDCILWLNDGLPNGVRVFDCATGVLYEPTTTGTPVGATITGHMQPRWVPSLNAAACWDNTSNTTVINLLNKPSNPRTGTWTISQITVAPSNTVTPTTKASNGTYGRFAYSNRLNGFVLLNSVTQKPYFFALD